MISPLKPKQRGNFLVGMVIGLLVGLALALGVALYIAKVPVPFINKVPQRTAEQDSAEAERNRNWDPNAALSGKAASRPAASASGVVQSVPASSGSAAMGSAPASAPLLKPAASGAVGKAASGADAGAKPAKDPAAILSGQASAPKPTESAAGALVYFVQVGAYVRDEEADAQRARVALLGFTAKVTEREQSGRTVYRVRIGPMENKEEAEATRDKLQAANVEAALVRVQR